MTTLSELIRHDEPLFVGASAAYPYKPAIERKYRFTSRYGDEVLLHRRVEDKIMLPRGLCPLGGADCRVKGEEVHFPKRPAPRPNQEELFDEVETFLRAGQSGLVVAPTGFGKTVIGYHAAAVVGVKTLVVCTKDDIYQQWIDKACGRVSPSNPEGTNFLGLAPHEVGEIRGDKCEVQGPKFCVAMIHSLSREGRYPSWVFDEFGLVIFDECHRVPAEQFSKVVDMFPARIRLGLSATPERSDGKELLVMAHVGPIRARAPDVALVPKVLRFRTGWKCPMTLRTNEETGEKEVVRIPHEPGKTTHIEKMMAADSDRNHMIADAVLTAYGKGRRVVVFSTLHDHLSTLHRALVKLGVPGKDQGMYVGATTRAEKEARERVKVKPVIFTTFGMMGEGTDIPWLDTAVFAMPRSNVIQPAGRVRREHDDKAEPVLMDFVDTDSPVFSGYADSRLSWYKRIGANIVDID